MNIEKAYKVCINKNRGWRGLAEADLCTESGELVNRMIFSFSNEVWTDLILRNTIVFQDDTNYYVIKIDAEDVTSLPIGHQRSVLIKHFNGRISECHTIAKTELSKETWETRNFVYDFLDNKNNHTTSDWNNIGIRVTPMI